MGQGQEQLTLQGKVHTQDYSFLVDSGASHNFVNSQFVSDNGLQCERGKKVQVRMANNDVVYTDKYVRCMVDFGTVSAYLLFTVLPSCPLVLGLSFLRAFKPAIDWENM